MSEMSEKCGLKKYERKKLQKRWA